MNKHSRADTLGGSLQRFWSMIRGGHNLWDNARFILAEVPLERSRVARALPAGLRVDESGRGLLFIVDYTQTSFSDPYHEAALLVGVRHVLFGRGLHCPWMIVDNDTALIYGRELLGYPKKLGAFEFVETDDSVRASITRRGVQVLSLEGAKGETQERPAPVFDVKTFNVGGPGSWFLLNPLWVFRPREVIHESRSMEVKVTIEPSEWDPISEFVADAPAAGRFVTLDIVNSRYNVPVGMAGPRFLSHNFNLRFR